MLGARFGEGRRATGSMDGARVRHELELRVVAASDRATPGMLVAYEDGR